MTLIKEKAPAATGAQNRNTNPYEGEPAMSIIPPDSELVCAAIDPESDTYCLREPGHDGIEHKSVRATWLIDAERDEEWAAAFLALHPEISAVVPEWADEVTISHVEADGSVHFAMETMFGDLEIGGVGIWRDGTVVKSSLKGAEAWFPGISTAINATGAVSLARVLRDRAIGLLLAAQRLERAEEAA
jgi:hypothetical protein